MTFDVLGIPTRGVEEAAWRGSRTSKMTLAEEMWPHLETRIERAIAKRTMGPPVMKAVLRAWELAIVSYQLHMLMRHHT
jgi:hypothetical protein